MKKLSNSGLIDELDDVPDMRQYMGTMVRLGIFYFPDPFTRIWDALRDVLEEEV